MAIKIDKAVQEEVAKELAPLIGWANNIDHFADVLEKLCGPEFDKQTFKEEGYKAWEKANGIGDDYIPFLED